MPDATEYTIASVDASNGTGGFDSGDAFRPTINSYMYGNALAIAHIAAMKGDKATSELYFNKATALKINIERDLWNDSLQHFTDRFKQNNQYVHYWDFIRGRELAGLIPWHFNLPDDKPKYNAAWKHAIDTSELLGRYGFRTNEPSYQYYFKQFVYFMGQRGSQWNGPSWPYQSSQALTGMANLLNNYHQDFVTDKDYFNLLETYVKTQYVDDRPYIGEYLDETTGKWLKGEERSRYYNHSTFNDLIITGLCGLRPRADDIIEVNPLLPVGKWDWFCLDNILYHGKIITIIWDKTGTKYKKGKGLSVWVNGKKVAGSPNLKKLTGKL
jgi:hypothetical protein